MFSLKIPLFHLFAGCQSATPYHDNKSSGNFVKQQSEAI